MNRKINRITFKIGEETVASLEADVTTIFDTENFKCILAMQYAIDPDEIEVSFSLENVVEPMGEMFIAITGKLCFNNDDWNAEIIEGLSIVDWVDLNTFEGCDTLLDYQILDKAEELIKFN